MRKTFLITVILSLLQVSAASAEPFNTEPDGNLAPASTQNADASTSTADQSNTMTALQAAAYSCMQEGGQFNESTSECRKGNAQATQRSTASLTSETSPCMADTDDAVKTCNFSDSKDAQLAVGMANQMVGQLKAMTVANQALLCSKMGAVSQALDVAVGAFSTYCSQAYSKCESSCTKEIQDIKEAIDAAPAAGTAALEEQKTALVKKSKSCASLSGNVKNIFQNVGSYAAMETAKSQYCGKKTDALAELCKSQPSNALCKTTAGTNCADPNVAATSIVCICQTKPNDPRCGAQAAIGLNNGLPNANGAASGSSSSGSEKLGDFGGLGGGADSGAGGFNSNAMNDGSGGGGFNPRAGVGGRGGGLGGGSGGGGQNGKGGAGAGGAGGGNGINAKIISGYGVGGVGGPAGHYGAGAGGGGANGNGMGGRNGYMAANGKPGVDLRKFLPGGQMDPSRGLAGVSGPDGMTGPNSDIWKKINMRYFSVTPSLLP